MIKVQDLASSHTSDHPHQPWPKQWKGALKHVIPRRTKAAFRRWPPAAFSRRAAAAVAFFSRCDGVVGRC
eukprot:3088858-Rhodomonas_salina.1